MVYMLGMKMILEHQAMHISFANMRHLASCT